MWWLPQNPVLETKWIQQQVDHFGGPQAIVAFAKLDSPSVEQTLKGHCQYPLVRGIRMALNKIGSFGVDRADYMQDPAWRKGYSLLSKYNLHFEMQIFDTQLPEAVELAKAFPDIPIVLQHLGWPLETTAEYQKAWKERLAELAALPNTLLKISCLGWIFKKPDEKAINGFIRDAISLFGVDRCMVGSNCPPDELYLSFDQIFHLIKVALSPYTEEEQQKMFYGNAKRVYRIF